MLFSRKNLVAKLVTLCLLVVAALCLGTVQPASALLLTDTVTLGDIRDVDLYPATLATFNLGGTFTSISSVILTWQDSYAGESGNYLGTAEIFLVTLGPDSFTLGPPATVFPAGPLTENVSFSAALALDLLDGIVDTSFSVDTVPPYTFEAFVQAGSTVTLTVEGSSAVPEPSTMMLIGTGLIGLAGFRRKFRV